MGKNTTTTTMNDVNKQEVNKEYRYTLEEELQIIAAIQQGDKERKDAIQKISQSKLRFVTAIAKRYANKGLSISELIEAGNKGIVLAAENFDERRGFKFICYAIWWVKQSINKGIWIKHNLLP